MTLPDAVPVDVAGWLLAGTSAGLLAVGVAGLAVRSEVPRPGGQVASAVALLVTLPLVMGGFLRWEPVFPVGPFPPWVVAFWAGVGVLGVLLVLRALRPRPRPAARVLRHPWPERS